ncbi:sensor histidine kinase [Microlunatus parietis]|uniref:histidine kinase n=1 Tax=Microlunatus parietis TaxID=682979 RepID=A0A7Y9I9C2_9ACTN|nr:HAMP domain-containing sensor histidine kinase [Microlunatus parietis]NYE72729.1 two-component system OmpR family sensor kinase [Microlunatus parietis]
MIKTAEPPGPHQGPGPFARGTLGRRLVLRVVALVAGVAIALGVITTLATRQLLLGTLDEQLRDVAGMLRPGPSNSLGDPGGQPDGTMYVVLDQDGAFVDGQVLSGRKTHRLSAQIGDALSGIPAGPPRSVTVPKFGSYRIVGLEVTIVPGGRGTLVVGVPADEVDSTLAQLIIVEAGLALLATGGAFLVARPLIERSLRPLNRVAGVAQQVSQFRLDRGDVAVEVRVSDADADPTSEVGRVGQALNHLLANVDGALAARQASETRVRRFVADASHELRNPLAAIRGYAELTRRDRDQLEPDTSYALDRIDAEAGRMSVLVEDLLLLARLDDRPELDLKPTDLSELVINAVSDARVAGPDHQWELDLPPEPVQAEVDHHRVHQVLVNLLANARTHTPAGSTVLTRLTEADDKITIMVRDDGPGVPPDIVDHVFERFTRAEASRARAAGAAKGASTGLGLAIVAAVVEAHHGTVSVASRPGLTEFTVTLPKGPSPNAR